MIMSIEFWVFAGGYKLKRTGIYIFAAGSVSYGRILLFMQWRGVLFYTAEGGEQIYPENESIQ
jgi:hypothetical protein